MTRSLRRSSRCRATIEAGGFRTTCPTSVNLALPRTRVVSQVTGDVGEDNAYSNGLALSSLPCTPPRGCGKRAHGTVG